MEMIERAKKLLNEMAADYVCQAVEEKIASGLAEWVLDPYIDGVVGLLVPGTNRALVVVYVNEGDFECDEERLGLC